MIVPVTLGALLVAVTAMEEEDEEEEEADGAAIVRLVVAAMVAMSAMTKLPEGRVKNNNGEQHCVRLPLAHLP